MRRPLSLVPALAAVALGVLALTAPAASAAPEPPASKGVPAAVAATSSPSSSSKLPVLPATKAFSDYQVVSSAQLTDVAGAQTSGSVVCPAGTKVLGGGAVIASSSLDENLNGSMPASDGRTWRVYVNNASTTDGTFTVYATCVKRQTGLTVVFGAAASNPSGTQTIATAGCPMGTLPLGGGGYGFANDLAVNLNSSFPAGDGWRVDVNNGSADGDTAYAAVVCGPKPNGYRVVSSRATRIAAGSQASATATCPSPLTVVGGGGYSNATSTSVNLNTSAPYSATTWRTYLDNGGAVAATLTAYAICARTV